MNNKSLSFVLVSSLVLSAHVFITEQANAEIFKCVNPKGVVFYNDKSCPKKDKETQIKAVKDPSNGYIPPAFVEQKEGKGNRGVVVGETSGRELISTKKEPSEDQQQANNNSSQRSNSNTNSNNNGTDKVVVADSDSSSKNPESTSSEYAENSFVVNDAADIPQSPDTIEDRMYRERLKLTQ